jgi:hypothetical protein
MRAGGGRRIEEGIVGLSRLRVEYAVCASFAKEIRIRIIENLKLSLHNPGI